jgi:ADP-ribosylglycohydrolase
MSNTPYQNMLLGIAIGDAYGAGYEFRYPLLKDYQNILLDKYIKSAFTDSDHFPGMYTDDTQMSIGVVELLISDKEFNKLNLANTFVECYKRDPIIGYAKNFQNFLNSVNSGEEFIKKIQPDSIRNGAAMRSVPLGLIYDKNTVIECATINAQLTHNTPKGIASSVAVALMSHIKFYENSRYEGSMDDVMSTLYSVIPKIDSESWEYFDAIANNRDFNPKLLFGEKHEDKGVPCDGMRTAGAVLYLMSRYDFQFPSSILIDAVKLGGDTDSVASIALGIGLIHDSVDNLPDFLYNNLTNHLYGRDYLLFLGNKLEKKFSLSRSNSL